MRALRFGFVFGGSEVRFPVGADELYHMRRIWFTVVNFPASLTFDRYMNHPEGAPPIWPPLFDWVIAALARGLVGSGDQHAVEVVAAWMPPLIGALGVVAAAWLVRRTFSPLAGFVTGALLVALPMHTRHSNLGMVDHHVAVGLFATLLLGAAMGLVGPQARPRVALVTGALIALTLLLWPGFLLQVVVIQLFFVAHLLATQEQPLAVARARSLAAAHGLATLLLAPFCVGHDWKDFGPLSPQVLSNFQPLWLGAAAVVFGLLALFWSRPALGRERRQRIGSALALGAFSLVAAWRGVPGLAEAVGHAAGWFEADPFLGVVSELSPLLRPLGAFDPAYGHGNFSYLFWAYPFALAGLAWMAFAERRAEVLLLLTVSAAFGAATLYQQRFGDVFAAGFALVMGPALAAVLRFAGRGPVAPRAAQAAAALVLGALALMPQALAYWDEWVASATVLRGERVGYGPLVRRRMVLERAARFLARESPPTAGYLDATVRPEYGVVSAWGQGHVLRYYSERPMVQDNFGPWGGRSGFDAAREYFGSRDEERAVEIAARLGARYVVASPMGSGQAPPARDSLALRLMPKPAEGGSLAFRDAPERALARHRLVFLTDDSGLARGRRELPFRAAVYEIVQGARVVGRAPGAEAVEFGLLVRVPGRPPLRYAARAPVDAAGGYELRLPYPSAAGYSVRSGSHRASLTLSLADVREGRTVAGPSFGG